MAYMGTIPHAWVDALAGHLSKDRRGGAVMAEQLLREESTRGPLVKMFTGGKLTAADRDLLPYSVTGQRIDVALGSPTDGEG